MKQDLKLCKQCIKEKEIAAFPKSGGAICRVCRQNIKSQKRAENLEYFRSKERERARAMGHKPLQEEYLLRRLNAKPNPNQKLLNSDVLEIRYLVGNGVPNRDICYCYGIARRTVTHAAHGQGWRGLNNKTYSTQEFIDSVKDRCISDAGFRFRFLGMYADFLDKVILRLPENRDAAARMGSVVKYIYEAYTHSR